MTQRTGLVGVALAVVISGLCLLPQAASAQIEVKVKLPVIRFEVQPALVVVAPGIQVVPEAPYEVYFVNGWYWTYHHGYWYRSQHWRTRWVVVERVHVPPGLVKIPRGKYKHYKGHHKHKHKHKAYGPKPHRDKPHKAPKGGGRGKGRGKGKKH